MYDLVIKNANLIDGLGNAMRQASVAAQDIFGAVSFFCHTDTADQVD